MNKIMVIFLLSIFLMSCQKYSTYIEDSDQMVSIIPSDTGIKNIDIIDWKVGPGFKQKVSKGVMVKVSFPHLRRDDIIKLNKNKKVDSWLLRVTRISTMKREVIGYLYASMLVPVMRGVVPNTTGYFCIYYAAAALSPRFENFHCPAFNHQKVINELSLEKRKFETSKIIISPHDRLGAKGRIHKFGLKPITLNGGMALEGRYTLEIAAYSQNEKSIKSRFVEFPEIIVVKSETDQSIKGCVNFRPSATKEEEDKIRRFKFGR